MTTEETSNVQRGPDSGVSADFVGETDLAPAKPPRRKRSILTRLGLWLSVPFKRAAYSLVARRIVFEIDHNADLRAQRMLGDLEARVDKVGADVLSTTRHLDRRLDDVISAIRADVYWLQDASRRAKDELTAVEKRLTLQAIESSDRLTEISERLQPEEFRDRVTREVGIKVVAEARYLQLQIAEELKALRMDEAFSGLRANIAQVRAAVAEQAAHAEQPRAEAIETLEALQRVETYALQAARRQTTRSGPFVIVRSNVGYVAVPEQDASLIANLVDTGELEPGTRILIERILKPGDCFIDVGANIGLHSIAAARRVGPSGRVFAFEPFPATVAAMRTSCWINGLDETVNLTQAAVFSAAGEQTLFLGRTSGHHSLFSEVIEAGVQGDMVVPAVTLDEAVPRDAPVDLIKIDVEGAELDVLAGASDLLQRNADAAIIVEFGLSHLRHRGVDAQAWLDGLRGYGVRQIATIDEEDGTLKSSSDSAIIEAESVNLLLVRGKRSIVSYAE